jgi:hypothetical protein
LSIYFVGSNLPDSYVPGGVISPASFLQSNFPPQTDPKVTALDSIRNTFVSLQGSGNKHITAHHMGARRQHDKAEQIQFLQNVHFPERQQNQAVTQGAVCLKKQVFTVSHNTHYLSMLRQLPNQMKCSNSFILLSSILDRHFFLGHSIFCLSPCLCYGTQLFNFKPPRAGCTLGTYLGAMFKKIHFSQYTNISICPAMTTSVKKQAYE